MSTGPQGMTFLPRDTASNPAERPWVVQEPMAPAPLPPGHRGSPGGTASSFILVLMGTVPGPGARGTKGP